MHPVIGFEIKELLSKIRGFVLVDLAACTSLLTFPACDKSVGHIEREKLPQKHKNELGL